MKVLFLLPDESGPAARFRGRAWVGPLGEHGVEVQAVVWPPVGPARARLLRSLPDHDAVMLVRRLPAVWDSIRLRSARRMVYDFDDAVMLHESGRPSPSRAVKFRLVLHAADTVTTSNEALRVRAAGKHPDVRVVPALVDLARTPPRPAAPAGAGPPVLGWMGSRSNLRYLQVLYPALAWLERKRFRFVFRVVCDAPPIDPPVPVDYRPWSEATEVAELHGFDVGLAPLSDGAWARAKSGMKILLYQAAALPVVASPVGANRELVRAEENGFLPTGPTTWEQAMTRLIRDADLRRKMGEAGRRSVEATRDLRAYVPRMIDILSGAPAH